MTDNRFINKALPSYQVVLGDETAGSKLILKFLGNYECGVTLLFSISLTSSFFVVVCLFFFSEKLFHVSASVVHVFLLSCSSVDERFDFAVTLTSRGRQLQTCIHVAAL